MKRYLAVAAIALLAGAGTAQAQGLNITADTAPKGEKSVCKSYQEIGSLVKKRKVCRSAAQWDKAYRAARDTHRGMVERGAQLGEKIVG